MKNKLLLILTLLHCGTSTAGDIVMVPKEKHKLEFEYTAYSAHLHSEAAKYGVPSGLLAGLIYTESRWNASAKSPAGAQGAAQFMPSTARWLANKYPSLLYPVNMQSMEWSITAAAIYLRDMRKTTGALYEEDCNAWGATLSSYNGGEGWAQKRFYRAPQWTRRDFWKVTRVINPGILASNQKENELYPVRIYLAQDYYAVEHQFCKPASVPDKSRDASKLLTGAVNDSILVGPTILRNSFRILPAIVRRRMGSEEQQRESGIREEA